VYSLLKNLRKNHNIKIRGKVLMLVLSVDCRLVVRRSMIKHLFVHSNGDDEEFARFKMSKVELIKTQKKDFQNGLRLCQFEQNCCGFTKQHLSKYPKQ
jgi:hypothetical protein